MCLAGFAIENLIKAIYVWRHRNAVDFGGGKIEERIRSHELRKLAKDVGLISADDSSGVSEFLDKLTEFTVWAGRYPVPTGFGKLAIGEQMKQWENRTC
jgi:hypothetical protein